MAEDTALSGESTTVIQRALAVLYGIFDELAEPSRWCQDAFARDAAGQPVEGELLAAIESPAAASRCLFSSLVHQGLARGYAIEVATEPGEEQCVMEVTRAPRSWVLAATALSRTALEQLFEHQLLPDETKANSSEIKRLGQLIVAATVILNDDGSYEDAIWVVVLAAGLLEDELDRRAAGGRP